MKVSVLIVEHDAADAELCVHELRREGFDVSATVVSTPGEFAQSIQAGAFDVVLADYRLPGWTGMDAFAALREAGSDVPLILVTGTLGEERAVDCVKLGVADYVIKQHIARLPMAVQRAVNERHMLIERANTERALRAREERFSQLAENITEVFFVMDVQFRETLYINPAYETIWGRSCQSLYDRPSSFMETIPEEDLGPLRESIMRNQQGAATEGIEFRVVRPDGTVRWVSSNAVPIRNEQGEVYRISGIALDITDRRHAEVERQHAQRALEESEALFRKLTEASFDGIVITEDGFIREANRGYAEMFGYELSEIIGMNVATLAADESRAEVVRRTSQAVEGSYEIVGQCKDGRKIKLEATAKTHMVAGKSLRIAALRDLTKQRALEEQFRQAQKMEAVGRLAGGIAHDFNNLLTVITSYAVMLLDDLGDNDPRRADVSEISDAATRAAGLTRQLLAFSRQQVIEPKVITLEEIVASAEKLVKRLIGEDIDVSTRLSERSCVVRIDPGQLEQVIMNLAINSRDAMPNGGKLTIETTVIEVDERLARMHWPAEPGMYAMLAVSDNGTGMDAQTQARIFEPFFTTKEAGKGTGLGLATVYGIVQQGEGFISVYSEVAHGTTFKIYLPYVAADQTSSPPEQHPAANLRGTETVLIVEDASAVRSVARQILERAGYQVLEATDGGKALSLAGSHAAHIDLLLTDVVMPEMNGRLLAEALKGIWPGLRILFMSGYTTDAVVRHGVLEPGIAFLQKPFTPDQLLSKVRATLDKPV